MVASDDVRPGRLAEGRLDRGPQTRFDLKVLVDPPTADPSRRPGDPARLLFDPTLALRLDGPAQRRHPRAARRRALSRRAPSAIGRRRPGHVPPPGRRSHRAPGPERAPKLRAPATWRPSSSSRVASVSAARRRSSAARRVASARRRRAVSASATRAASARRRVACSSPLAASAARSRPISSSAIGQLAVDVADGRLEPGVALRDRQRSLAPADDQVRLGGPAFLADPLAIPGDRCRLGRQPRLAQGELGQRAAGQLVGLAPTPLDLGAGAERRRRPPPPTPRPR